MFILIIIGFFVFLYIQKIFGSLLKYCFIKVLAVKRNKNSSFLLALFYKFILKRKFWQCIIHIYV